METRVCKHCQKEKDLTFDNFSQVKSSTGLKVFRGTCRVCFNEQTNNSWRKRRSDPKYRRAELDREKKWRAKIIDVRGYLELFRAYLNQYLFSDTENNKSILKYWFCEYYDYNN